MQTVSPKPKCKKKAFTLVELVIVIAVIAVLAAVLIPTFSGIIDSAQYSSALSQATTCRDQYIVLDYNNMQTIAGCYIVVGDIYVFSVGSDLSLSHDDTYNSDNPWAVSENSLYTTGKATIYPADSVDSVSASTTVEDGNFSTAVAMAMDEDSSTDGSMQYAILSVSVTATTFSTLDSSTDLSTWITTKLQNGVLDLSDYQITTIDTEIDTIQNNTYLKKVTTDKSSTEQGTLILPVTPTNTSSYSGITSIESGAFEGCDSLESLEIPFVGSELDGADNTFFGYIFGDTKALTAENTATNIPVSLKTVKITGGKSIGDSAFMNCSGLEEVTIPDSVETIDSAAFRSCSGLIEVIIPDSVESIGSSAFRYCSDMVNLTIGSGVTSIGSYAFSSNTSLEKVEFNADDVSHDLTSSAPFSLSGSTAYCQLIIGDGVTSIGENIFRDFDQLNSVIISSSVTNIDDCAFASCYVLSSVTIVESAVVSDQTTVITVDSDAFSSCQNLVVIFDETSADNSGSTSLGSAIGTAASTTVVSSEEDTTALVTDDDGFIIYNSTTIVGYVGTATEIAIPDSITTIQGYSIYYNDNLTVVIIPESVTKIQEYAFEGSSNLTIYLEASSVPSSYSSGWDRQSHTNTTYFEVYCYAAETPEYVEEESYCYWYYDENGNPQKYAAPIEDQTDADTDTGTNLEPGEIKNAEDTDLIFAYDESALTATVTGISESWNSSNTTLTIPAQVVYNGDTYNVTSIQGDVDTGFGILYESDTSYWSSITSVIIEEGITTIDTVAFSCSYYLTSITIPSTVVSIAGSSTFYGCYMLAEVYNLSSMSITAGATTNGYVGCYALGVYTSADSVSKLTRSDDGFVIYDDNTVVGYVGTATEITIPDYIIAIKAYAFYDCTSLTSITIPSSVTSIGSCAFQYCKGLTTVYFNADFSSDITYGSTTAPFRYSGSSSNGCTLIIGDNVTYLPAYMFYDFDYVTCVVIPASITTMSNYAFALCANLTIYCESNSTYSAANWNYGTSATSSARPTYYAGSWGYDSDNVPTAVEADWVYDSNGNYIEDSSTEGDGGTYSSGETTIDTLTFGYNTDGTASVTGFDGSSSSVEIPATISVNDVTYNVTSIGRLAFYQYTSLTSVDLLKCTYLDAIEYGAFANTGLTSITIPSSVTYIGGYAFYYCDDLQMVDYKAEITSNIDYEGAVPFYFAGGSYGYTVIIGNNVTFIPALMFAMSCLTAVTLPDNAEFTSIEDGLFGQTCLTTIDIPSSVTSIGDEAFIYSDLTSITIPTSVTTIGASAFYNCTKLTTVYYTGTETQWNISSNDGSGTFITSSNNSQIITTATKYYNGQWGYDSNGVPTTDAADWVSYYNSDGELVEYTS